MELKVMERISVTKAAQIMHLDPHFIRLCLQDGTFAFGVAKKKPGNKKWSYYISPKLFYEYVGMGNANA